MLAKLVLLRDRIFPVDRLFRDIRNDLQLNLLHNFSNIVIVFTLICAYLLIGTISNNIVLFCLLVTTAFLTYQCKELAKRHFALSRYAFIALLLMSFFFSMVLYPAQWMPVLGLPLILVGGLLVSRSVILIGFGIFSIVALLNIVGIRAYDLDVVAILIVLTIAITTATVETFYIALSWYGTMHQRAEKLLHSARDQRAELTQTLKSLDISYLTQKRLQTQLIQARQQANESRRMKERFAANISHELRTPLNLILGFSEIMYLTPEVYGNVSFSPSLTRDIYQIYRSSKYLLDMIDDVLDLSHIELSSFTLNFEATPMNEFLTETLEILQTLFRDPNVTLRTHIPANLPTLEIDRTRIRQVFLNLFNNARRFTEKGYVELRVIPTDSDLVFEVTDTGIGIPAEKLLIIFDEFYQVDYSLSRKHGGSGLGLAITKRFLEAHNGEISVESRESVGSTFRFSLPLPKQPLPNVLLNANAHLGVTDKPYIAVLDADPLIISLIQRYLTDYIVIPINTQQDIPAVLAEYQVNALIHNISPYNKHPLDTTTLPVPYITFSLPSYQWMVEQLGVSDCLAKPITPSQIAQQITKHDPINRILIVDDDLGFVQLVQRSIETLSGNYRIFRAYDGIQALDMINQYRPGLVFLDIAMPDMNGFEVLKAIQDDESLKDIPIILLTATRYVQSELEIDNRLSVSKRGGLKPIETLRCLQEVLKNLDSQPIMSSENYHDF